MPTIQQCPILKQQPMILRPSFSSDMAITDSFYAARIELHTAMHLSQI